MLKTSKSVKTLEIQGARIYFVILFSGEMVKQHPYRVSPMKKELLDKEVQYMLKNDIIEESQSNWSSPCILVPKHDGFRFWTFEKSTIKQYLIHFPYPESQTA